MLVVELHRVDVAKEGTNKEGVCERTLEFVRKFEWEREREKVMIKKDSCKKWRY